MEFINPDNIPPEHPMHHLVGHLKKKAKLNKELDEQSKKASEQADNDLLMPLWQKLGDHAETYWGSMLAVHTFVELKKSIDDALEYLDPRIMGAVCDALSQHCLNMKNQTTIIHDVIEKYFPET